MNIGSIKQELKTKTINDRSSRILWLNEEVKGEGCSFETTALITALIQITIVLQLIHLIQLFHGNQGKLRPYGPPWLAVCNLTLPNSANYAEGKYITLL